MMITTRYGEKMKPQKPRVKKARKEPTQGQGTKNPVRVTTPWGRGASDYRPGLFTRQYFVEHGEACAADIYYALSEEIERLNKERIDIQEKPLKRPNYSSFSRYFHWFKLLGLVESTDRFEPAVYDFLQEKHYYRLTEKGKVEEAAWGNPIKIAHPELG